MSGAELAVVLALAASSPATRVGADGMTRAALDEADKTWVSWGMPPAGPPELRVYDAPAGDAAVARAAAGNSIVYITRAYRDRTWELANDSGVLMSARVSHLAQLYAVMAHERGHNMGLGHEPTGIMHDPGPQIPARGFTWAANWIKSRRLQNAQHRATMERT